MAYSELLILDAKRAWGSSVMVGRVITLYIFRPWTMSHVPAGAQLHPGLSVLTQNLAQAPELVKLRRRPPAPYARSTLVVSAGALASVW